MLQQLHDQKEAVRTKAHRVVAKYSQLSNSKKKYGCYMTTFDVHHGEVINPTKGVLSPRRGQEGMQLQACAVDHQKLYE